MRTNTLSLSSLDNVIMLYISIVRNKLEYAFVVQNCLTNTDSNKGERGQRTIFCLIISNCSILLHFCIYADYFAVLSVNTY
jgi:hypothetical protein